MDATARPPLAACGDCDVQLRRVDLLIEYEPGPGRRSGYAECPGCRRVYKVDLAE